MERDAAARARPARVCVRRRRHALGRGPGGAARGRRGVRLPQLGRRRRRTGHDMSGVAWLLVLLSATASGDERLRARLDAETAAAVTRIVESARAEGLPTEPL